MTNPNFGYTQSRPQNEPVPVIGADFSHALVIDSGDGVSDTEYPLDTAVRISTSDKEARAALGTGRLADAVKGIDDQLTGLNRGATVTVLRTAAGENEAAAAAAIVNALSGVGSIPSVVNSTPRLVVAGQTKFSGEGGALNPVLAALPAALEKLLAVAPVEVDTSTAAGAIAARELMSSQRIMPVGIGVRTYEGTDLVTRSAAPRVAGLFIRGDNANEGKPFDPIANQPLYGIAGLSRALPFSLLDGSTEGQQMLNAGVSIIAQGEVGVDGAVSNGGFVFIGTDNADTGELWNQIHQVRGADYITVKLVTITREFLGRKTTADLVEAYVNSILFMLRDHKAADDILGYNPDVFIPDQNSPEQIRLGRIRLDLGIEQAPVFKTAHNAIHRYRPAVEGLVSEIVNRLNTTL